MYLSVPRILLRGTAEAGSDDPESQCLETKASNSSSSDFFWLIAREGPASALFSFVGGTGCESAAEVLLEAASSILLVGPMRGGRDRGFVNERNV